MTLNDAIIAQAKAYAPLNALISGRVMAGAITENTALPALVITRVSGPSAGRHRDNSASTRVRYQIDGWAANNADAQALRSQIRNAFRGWSRSSSPRVDRTLLADDRDLPDAATGRRRVSIDFDLWAQED